MLLFYFVVVEIVTIHSMIMIKMISNEILIVEYIPYMENEQVQRELIYRNKPHNL